MLRLTALILGLLTIQVPLSTHAQGLTDTGAHPFAIDFPQDVDVGKVQANYFITGTFGGYGEFAFEKSGEHRILLHTEVKGIPGATLKAILYVPGCQIVTLNVPALAESNRQSGFQCRPLPTIAFTGRVASSKPIEDPQPVVNVRYEAGWSMRFFGIMDGGHSAFQIATVPLEPDATFHLTLPDFSKDAVTNANKASEPPTGLSFMARNAKTWNILGILGPPNARWQFEDLQIQSEYPPEVVFTFHQM